MTFTLLKKKDLLFIGSALVALASNSSVQADSTVNKTFLPKESSIASTQSSYTEKELEFDFDKKEVISVKSDCDVFEAPRSIACIGPGKTYQPKNNIERFVQGSANYAARFFPLLNSGASGREYTNILVNDGTNLMVDSANLFANKTINRQVQQIPFFAQTTIALNLGGSEGTKSFSLDGLFKLKELSYDEEGDLKTLLFSQAKFTTSDESDGHTTNFGLGLRHRPTDNSMLGGNIFIDLRSVDSSSYEHARFGLGSEYFLNDFEVRNNIYFSANDTTEVIVDGATYTERVVPGFDFEVGYRLPKNPELAFFVKGFNWDYKDTQDNTGLEGSLNWQATPNINIEAWLSNEISATKPKLNSALPGTSDTFYGLRFKWTAQPVKFKKRNYKQNLITQMTQPVRRNYQVLLERSNSWTNRAKGS